MADIESDEAADEAEGVAVTKVAEHHVDRAGHRAFCSCGWEWMPGEDYESLTEGQLWDLARNMATGHFIHVHDRKGTIDPRAVHE